MPKEILIAHARQYPKMQPCDAVKLLYQGEFGGGHMIADENACMEFLRREYVATPQSDIPLLEIIGKDMVRVQLSGLNAAGYSPEQLGQDFIRSAASVRGSMDIFLEKLTTLRELTQLEQMPFSLPALEAYLSGYAAEGYPAVSHSETYRNAYHPAYRVLHIDYLPYKYQKQV